MAFSTKKKTNKNILHITVGKVGYHVKLLATNNKPLTQLFSHI